jgi:hypothetical protein
MMLIRVLDKAVALLNHKSIRLRAEDGLRASNRIFEIRKQTACPLRWKTEMAYVERYI